MLYGRRRPDSQPPGVDQTASLANAIGPIPDLIMALERIARYDQSVSVSGLGSVFQFDPSTPLGRDQTQLADTYGVPFAWPSTSGTTPLNSLAMMTVTSPGDVVLIQRDCHTSIYASLIHLGLRPIYLTPPYAADLGISLGVTPEEISRALMRHPETRAVVLTYPNYFGVATDIVTCAKVVRAHRIPLIIDAAHGSHLRFHPRLPHPAEDTSATIITQSAHKTASALSQGSLALFNDTSVVPRFYEMVNQLGFISTSFSYIILQSVILSVLQLKLQGKEMLDTALAVSEQVRDAINDIDQLSSFGLTEPRPGFAELDPLRVTIDVSRTGLTGYAVATMLAHEFGIYPELTSVKNILLLFTLADEPRVGSRITTAMRTIARRNRQSSRTEALLPPTSLPRQLLLPRDVFFNQRRRRLPVREAIGLPSSETIAAYPPGSPLIVGGEEITEEAILFLQEIRSQGGTLKGCTDPTFATITVAD